MSEALDGIAVSRQVRRRLARLEADAQRPRGPSGKRKADKKAKLGPKVSRPRTPSWRTLFAFALQANRDGDIGAATAIAEQLWNRGISQRAGGVVVGDTHTTFTHATKGARRIDNRRLGLAGSIPVAVPELAEAA